MLSNEEHGPVKHGPENNFQLIYGIALLLAGIGVFFRIPQVMPQIETFKQFASASWFIRFCFYFIGIILIGGGIKKIWHHFKGSYSENRKER